MNSPLASKIQAVNSALYTDENLDSIEDFFAIDYIVHVTDNSMKGHNVIRGFLGTLRKTFPEIEIEVKVLIESGDRISWQRTLRGVQSGAFLGFPASDQHVVWRDMVTSRFCDGLIAEEWVVTDLAERLLLTRKG